MNQIIKSLVFIVCVGTSFQATSQSLQAFIKTALENNYQLKIVKNEVIRAELYNTRGNAGQLPTVSMNGGLSTSFNNTYLLFADGSEQEGNNAQTTNMNMGVMANWTVFKGFSIIAQKELLEQLVEMGELNATYYIEQTVTDIIASYHAIAYQKSLLKSYATSMKISAYRYQLETERKRVGSGDFKSYGQAYYDYHLDSINWIKQTTLIDNLILELNRLTSSDLEQEVMVDSDLFNPKILPNKDTLIADVKSHNSDLDRVLLAQKIEETELRMQRSARYPTIDIFAGYQYGSSVAEIGFIKQNRNFGPQLGVSITYNLFNGGKTNTAIKNAELTLENTQFQTEDVELNLNASVLKLYQEHAALLKQKAIAQNSMEIMQNVVEIAEIELREGQINGYDFRQSQVSLLKAEQTLIQVDYSLRLVEINLDLLRGTILDNYVAKN